MDQPIEWKTFGPGDMYRISNTGVVQTRFDFKTKKLHEGWTDKALKKSKTDSRGGYYLTFSMSGKHVRLHTFMWEMWVGPRTPGMVIDHKDGNRMNCAIWNLREVTQKENIANLMERGNFNLFGRKNYKGKLHEEKIGVRNRSDENAAATTADHCVAISLAETMCFSGY